MAAFLVVFPLFTPLEYSGVFKFSQKWNFLKCQNLTRNSKSMIREIPDLYLSVFYMKYGDGDSKPNIEKIEFISKQESVPPRNILRILTLLSIKVGRSYEVRSQSSQLRIRKTVICSSYGATHIMSKSRDPYAERSIWTPLTTLLTIDYTLFTLRKDRNMTSRTERSGFELRMYVDLASLSEVVGEMHTNQVSLLVSLLEEVFNNIMRWPLSEKYLFFKKLQSVMLKHQLDIRKYLNSANDIERIKLILGWKKEIAIRELENMLPYVDYANENSTVTYLRILPVFFSYSTLYDMEVKTVMKIVQTAQFHATFENYQNIFGQWVFVFQRRISSKKPFMYKDESCVRDLPQIKLKNCKDDFTDCIGYFDIHLFRSFHRWLRLLRLHKYLFFFASLSYKQILRLNDESFDKYEEEFNLVKVTIGAKSKILREIERLRQRRQNLENLVKVQLISSDEIEKAARDIKKILRTPIPMNDTLGENIPQWLVVSLHHVFNSILTNLNGIDECSISIYGLFISLLKEAWNYNIFTATQKDSFNEWRTRLSDTMNNLNIDDFYTPTMLPYKHHSTSSTKERFPSATRPVKSKLDDNNNDGDDYEPRTDVDAKIDPFPSDNFQYALRNIGNLRLYNADDTQCFWEPFSFPQHMYAIAPVQKTEQY